MSIRLALAQSAGELSGKAARLAWLESQLQTHATDCDVMLLPESFLHGYHIPAQIPDMAEQQDGPSAQIIAKLARQYQTAILYGYAEQTPLGVYNAAQCFNAQGQSIANHRKLALPPGFEQDRYIAGQEATTFTLNDITFGLLICYDIEFPETCRHMANLGVHCILAPTALGVQWGVVSDKLIPTRAFENGVYVCYANHAGVENELEYFGGSCIIDPTGNDIARAGAQPEILFADIATDRVKAAQKRLPYLQAVQKLHLS